MTNPSTSSSSPAGSAAPSQAKVSPGMVLGPDGKPCRVCTAFRTFAKSKPSSSGDTKAGQDTSKRAPAKNTGSVLAALGLAGAASASASSPSRVAAERCPPDSEALGRATWTFLHTTAAYYPISASPTQRTHMLALLRALPTLYPCSHCATHFGERMLIHPPDVSGRGPLSRWLCERHNDVNELLHKEIFDCSRTDERWRDGPPDGSCD